MSKDERLSYVVLLVGGLLFFTWIGPSEIDAGENASISPRLLPYIYTALIVVLAVIGLAQSWRAGTTGWTISREQAKRMGIVLAALALSAWLAGAGWLPRDARFWVASVPTVLVGLWLSDMRSPRFIMIYSTALIAITWVLVELTGIQLR